MSNKLRVLIFQADYGWVAQCLDYAISAQGPTIKETKKRFGLTILGQVVLDAENNREPLKWLGKPPEHQEICFENGEKIESKPIMTGLEESNFPREIISDARIYA